MLEQVARDQSATNFAVSKRGALVYAPSVTGNTRSIVWVDRQGREQPIAAPPRPYDQVRLSPDGSRFAVAINEGRGYGLWVWDLTLQQLTRLPFEGSATFIVWSRDGRYLVTSSTREGNRMLVRRAVDGSGTELHLMTSDSRVPSLGGWPRALAISPDGKRLLFELQTPELAFDLMTLSLDDPAIGTEAGARPSALLATPSDERNASFAPDGRWIAYESNKSGQSQVYVKPFPNVGDAEYQISTEGGRAPLWSPDGHELFFVGGSALIAVAVELTPTFKAGNSTALFEAGSRILDGRLVGSTARTYDISRDGQRFLMTKDASGGGQSSGPGIVVVQNWFQELQDTVRRAR